MTKHRFMKIMSWYLIISMVFQVIPANIMVAFAFTEPQQNTDGNNETDSNYINGTETNGFTLTLINEKGVKLGDYLTEPFEVPSPADGYMWIDASCLSSTCPEVQSGNITLNKTTTLMQVSRTQRYKVTYYIQHHDNGRSDAIPEGLVANSEYSEYYNVGTRVFLPDSSKYPGYRFENWRDDKGQAKIIGGSYFDMPSGEVYLRADLYQNKVRIDIREENLIDEVFHAADPCTIHPQSGEDYSAKTEVVPQLWISKDWEYGRRDSNGGWVTSQYIGDENWVKAEITGWSVKYTGKDGKEHEDPLTTEPSWQPKKEDASAAYDPKEDLWTPRTYVAHCSVKPIGSGESSRTPETTVTTQQVSTTPTIETTPSTTPTAPKGEQYYIVNHLGCYKYDNNNCILLDTETINAELGQYGSNIQLIQKSFINYGYWYGAGSQYWNQNGQVFIIYYNTNEIPSVTPTEETPSVTPTEETPSVTPTEETPSVTPTEETPSVTPTEETPSVTPTEETPSVTPTEETPSVTPTEETPSVTPTEETPSVTPTEETPSVTPTEETPSVTPTEETPSVTPTEETPSVTPTEETPSVTPTEETPSVTPTEETPSVTPTEETPSVTPTEETPSVTPTEETPSVTPTEETPSVTPTEETPSVTPTEETPSVTPTEETPSVTPTEETPSVTPTEETPSVTPTEETPSVTPTEETPSVTPTEETPSVTPTEETPSVTPTEETPSVTPTEETPSVTPTEETPSVTPTEETPSVTPTEETPSVTPTEETPSVTPTEETPSVTPTEETPSVTPTEETPSVTPTEETPSVTPTEETPSVTPTEETPSVTPTEETPSVTPTEETPSVTPTEETPSVTPTEETPSVTPTEETPSVTPTEETPSVTPTEETPSVTPTEETPSVTPTEETPSVTPTEETPSVTPTEETPSVTPTEETPSVTPTEETPSVTPTEETPSVTPTEETPSVTPTEETPSVTPTEETPSVTPTEETPSVTPTEETPSVTPTEETPSVTPTEETPSVTPTEETPSVTPTEETPTLGTMTVKAEDYEGVYDGASHEGGATPSVVEGTTILYSLDGENWSSVIPSITDAGEVTYYVKATNPNYEDAFAKGTLIVHKREVVLVSGDAEKKYDGTALTNTDVEVKNSNGLTTETGWVEGEGATYDFTGSQVEVGSSANAFGYTLKENTKADNYIIKKTEGTLTVTDNQHKVTYSYTGDVPVGAPEYPGEETYRYLTPVTVAATRLLEGYIFSGWSTDDVRVSNGGFLMPDQDVLITGSWLPRTDTKYTVKHWLQNLENDEYSQDQGIAPDQVLTGTTGMPTAAEAYDLDGFTAQAFEQETIAPDGSTVVNIYYNRNSYTVSYVYDNHAPNETPLPETVSYKYGETVTIAPDATATGYTFSGWDKTGTFTMPAEDVEIHGSWTVHTHTITYVYEGDVPSGAPSVPPTKTYNYGDPVPDAPVPSVEGYTFVGWKGEPDIMPDEDVIVTGSWVPNNYNLTYIYTGDVIPPEAPAVPAGGTYTYGETVKKAAVPAVIGYTFSGWNGEPSTMPAHDVVVPGSWTLNKYTVTYVYEGDVPEGAPEVPPSASYAYGEKVPAATVPSVEGYTFVGWNNEPGTMPASDVVVTGRWVPVEKVDDTKYTVTYVYLGKVPADAPAVPAAADYEAGADVPKAEVPSLEGYIFNGWNGEVSVMPAQNVTVTGSWEKVTHTVTIIYKDAITGKEIHERVVLEEQPVGQTFSVQNPEIEGYVTKYDSVSGVVGNQDIVITVLYVPNAPTPTPTPRPEGEPGGGDEPENEDYEPEIPMITYQLVDIEDFETPLGLGGLNLNVGECIE